MCDGLDSTESTPIILSEVLFNRSICTLMNLFSVSSFISIESSIFSDQHPLSVTPLFILNIVPLFLSDIFRKSYSYSTPSIPTYRLSMEWMPSSKKVLLHNDNIPNNNIQIIINLLIILSSIMNFILPPFLITVFLYQIQYIK